MNRCLLLFGLSVLVCGHTAQAAPAPLALAQASPIMATVAGMGLPGTPIWLSFSLSDTTSKEFSTAITSHPCPWEFRVDWLGGDGLGPPVVIRGVGDRREDLQAEGVGLSAFSSGMNMAYFPLAGTPGAVESVPINDLFDMSRQGIYSIRVGRTVYLDARDEVRKTYWSAPVATVVW